MLILYKNHRLYYLFNFQKVSTLNFENTIQCFLSIFVLVLDTEEKQYNLE